MNIHSRYLPPPMPGYVFYSNFGRVDLARRLPSGEHPDITKDVAANITAARLDVPFDDVLVVDFNPDSSSSIYANTFAAFVKDRHADVVKDANDRLTFLLQALLGRGID